MSLLECVIVDAVEAPSHCVIFLHGLGADGHDFESIVPELAQEGLNSFRYVFPHAPYQKVTLNGGYRMRAWYDIAGLDFDQRPDFDGMNRSVDDINLLIEAEHRSGFAYEHILLAGFSQGGVIALRCGLNFPQRLAGILALSTYFPVPDPQTWQPNPANAQTPIFMAHGTNDNVVKLRFGEYSRELLRRKGCSVDWHQYAMAHSVCPEEIKQIGRWLKSITLKVK